MNVDVTFRDVAEFATVAGAIATWLRVGGRRLERFEAVVKKIESLSDIPERMRVLEIRFETLENAIGHHVRSDHRELRADMRSALASFHEE